MAWSGLLLGRCRMIQLTRERSILTLIGRMITVHRLTNCVRRGGKTERASRSLRLSLSPRRTFENLPRARALAGRLRRRLAVIAGNPYRVRRRRCGVAVARPSLMAERAARMGVGGGGSGGGSVRARRRAGVGGIGAPSSRAAGKERHDHRTAQGGGPRSRRAPTPHQSVPAQSGLEAQDDTPVPAVDTYG